MQKASGALLTGKGECTKNSCLTHGFWDGRACWWQTEARPLLHLGRLRLPLLDFLHPEFASANRVLSVSTVPSNCPVVSHALVQ